MVATEQMQQDARDSTDMHSASSSYGWLVALATLTIVGIIVWMVVTNSEDAV